jgi:2-polyprenyl-6-methoxyphenol hydroxylase-like FAD-dependent oxidoreductase
MRVAIIGGSLGGLFAGVLLARAGHEVLLFERSRSGLEGRGAGLVIQRDVFSILRAIGCEHVARVGVVAKERVTFDRAGQIVERHETPQTQVSWDLLYKTFREQLPADSYVGAEAVVEVGQGVDGAWLRTAGGRRIDADLLIGADGIGSLARSAVALTAEGPQYSGYVAWRGLVPETSLPRQAEILLDRFAFFNDPGSHALGYLVPGVHGDTSPGDRRYNWVWYRDEPNLAARLTDRSGHSRPYSLGQGQVSDAAVAGLLRAASTYLPDPFSAAVHAEPQPFIQAIFDLYPSRLVNGRIVLIGDAASIARPHTAMGVAKAAADAMALTHALDGCSLRPALVAYEKERLDAHRAVVAYGQRLGAALDLVEPGARAPA